MTEHLSQPPPEPPAQQQVQQPVPALSFGAVADAYDRARPSYPREAVAWLVGGELSHVLELGAGTGKLTEQLAALGHRVLATDPLEPMLRHLVRRLPATRAVLATAEQIPVRGRSVDAVIGAQAFHWFDLDRALPEIARVLRPGGRLGLVWNLRDERIPWVRRLGALIGTPTQPHDPTHALLSSHLFGFVETTTYRFWQPMDRGRLHDLVRSRSAIALLPDPEREQVIGRVDELYEEYGRGPDGMLMPYVTHCYRAVVRPPAPVEELRRAPRDPGPDDGDDTGALLIDFP
jgi:ubiquinone/menaquinone biosynthesis C-methylase UbiE